ncbi:unnamed protein product [Cylicocyclus nassatus]|uniref:Uncharacterized protein n=1 Tax=Cylicocyclus nassatus TaxID=53992 RepID=A0AA36DQ66_CYLNA|nr:unnamed protein product [Cylicocyclus nassatus]
MTENDAEIAKALGKQASFCGLRTAESGVCANEPSTTRPPSAVEDNTCRAELLHTKCLECVYTNSYCTVILQFESETEDEELAPPRTKSCIQQQFDENKEMLRSQRLVLEKQHGMCIKMDV